jgi:hypothetical protein
MVHKIMKLTKEQFNRVEEIRKRLWEIYSEETKLKKELDDFGLSYDILGRPEQKIKVVK